MPAPTTSWNLVRVYGKWRNMDGTLKSGTYRVTIPTRVTNSTDDAIIPAGQFTSGQLQTASGSAPSLDVQVPATDDPDTEQTGWKVSVDVTFTDGSAGESYIIDVPYAARPIVDGGTGAGVNLRTVAFPSALPQTNALYRVGVAGGLAKLNSSGQVVDANGTPVTGGGSGGVSSWNDLTDKPTTFAPIIGTTSTTAKAGNYAPTWTEITSKPTTFAPIIGSTSTTAVAGNDARLTDARTPTAHTHTTADVTGLDSTLSDIGATAANLQATKADITSLPVTQRVKLASDVSITSQTSMTNLTGLTLTAVANAEYDVSMLLFMKGDTNADANIDITGPSGATLMLTIQSLAVGAGAVSGGHRTDAITALSTASATIGLIDTTTLTPVVINGWVKTTTAGTFQVRWKQAITSATANVTVAGSTLTAVRVA